MSIRAVFNDKKKLEEMLNLRKAGWTYQSLAMIYGVDHSSIYGQCKKYGIPKSPVNINLNISSILVLLEIRSKPAKSYSDYLVEERHRRFPKLYASSNTI
jgi:hypothetical protein